MSKYLKNTLSLLLALILIMTSFPVAVIHSSAASVDPINKSDLQVRWFVNNVTADESGKGRNPSSYGSYKWTRDESVNCVDFTNGYFKYKVSSGNLLSNSICGGVEGGQGTTIAFMAKADTSNESPYFCLMNDSYTSDGKKTLFSLAPNGATVYTNSAGSAHNSSSATSSNLGVWHTYIIRFFSSKSLEIYVDGNKTFGESSDYYDNHTFDIPDTIKVGVNRENNSYFDGKIRDFRVYNTDVTVSLLHSNLLACSWEKGTINVTPATVADLNSIKQSINSFTPCTANAYGKFRDDGDYTNYSDHWKSLIYAEEYIDSHSKTGSVQLGSDGTGSNTAYANMYVPSVVALYTKNNPISIPVLASVSVARSGTWSCKFKIWGITQYYSALSFANSVWSGRDVGEGGYDNCYANGNQTTNIPHLNFMWTINQNNYTLKTTEADINSYTGSGVIDPGYGKNASIFANKLLVNNVFDSNATQSSYKKYNPNFTMYVSVNNAGSGSAAQKIYFGDVTDSIYVVDYQKYLDLISKIQGDLIFITDTNRYTADSLSAYLTAIKKVLAINPADTSMYNFKMYMQNSVEALVEDINDAINGYNEAYNNLVPQYKVTFRNSIGSDVKVQWLTSGQTPTAPANTEVSSKDANTHYEYVWPQIAAVSDADKVYTEQINVVNHTFTSLYNVTEAKCGVNRVDHVKCDICGNEQNRSIENTALEHNYVPEVIEPDCLNGGYTVYKCSYCEDTYTGDEQGAKGHDFSVLVKEKVEPTCSEFGYTPIYKCSRCEERSGGGQIAKLAHTEEIIPAVVATCQNKGSTEGKMCSVCKEILVEPKGITKANHQFKVYVADGNATCAEDGTKTASCIYAYDGCDKIDTIPDVNSHTKVSHTFDENGIKVKNPTCITKGETKYFCTVCSTGYEIRDDIDIDKENGHNYQKTSEYKAPTCNETGKNTEYKCEYCNEIKGGEILQATGVHAYSVVKAPLVPATCKEDGKQAVLKCVTCDLTTGGEIISKDTVDHSYEAIVTEPTCITSGYTTNVCKVCGNSYVITGSNVDAKNHSYEVIDNGFAPTCIAEGKEATYKCKLCGDITGGGKIEINPNAHNAVVLENVESTCDKTGLTEGKKCSLCNKILIEQTVIETIPHTLYTLTAVEATCTKTGLTEGKKCSVCKNVVVAQEIVPMKKHTPVSANNGVEATCTKAGKEADTVCEVCKLKLETGAVIPVADHVAGEAKTENKVDSTCKVKGHYDEVKYCVTCNKELSRVTKELDLAAHTEVVMPAVDATCTENGLTEGKKCSVCGFVLESQTIIPAAHKPQVVNGVDATCTVSGLTEGSICSVCKKVLTAQQTINPLTHKYQKSEEAIEPTCTAEGKTAVYKCIRCDDEIGGETIVASGHKYEYFTAKAPTCGEDGWNAYQECKVCHISTKEIRPATNNHIFSILVESALKPSCTTDGKTAIYKCKTCDKTSGGVIIYSTGHDYIDHEGKASTCLTPGYKPYRTCSKCSYTSYEIIPATGNHVYSVVVKEKIEATCTSVGYEAIMRCETCTATIGGNVIPVAGHKDEDRNGYCDSCGEKIPCEHINTVYEGMVTADCVNRGYTGDLVCTDCNTIVVKGNIIPASGHIEEIIPAVPATCISTGLSQGSRCKVCNAVLFNQYEIPTTNHYRLVRKGYAATCISSGLTDEIYCRDCNEVFSPATVIPMTDHTDYNRDYVCDECGVATSIGCDCICHHAEKSVLSTVVYRILRVFWKIFNTNKRCDCGVNHF